MDRKHRCLNQFYLQRTSHYTSFHVPVNSYCTEEPITLLEYINVSLPCTLELQWLEHLWNHENLFETGVVRAKECCIKAPGQEA